MHKLGVSPNQLMQESESYIESLHHESFSSKQIILEPLFDNPRTYCQWEAGHFRLMKTVAEDMRADRVLEPETDAARERLEFDDGITVAELRRILENRMQRRHEPIRSKCEHTEQW